MIETDLIQKLQTLKTVEANQKWLISARRDILSAIDSPAAKEQNSLFGSLVFSALSLRLGAALAGFFVIALTSGTFVLAGNSLPGDALYNVKLASEVVQNSLPASPTMQAQRQDASAQRRVDELAQVIQNMNASSGANQKELTPAVTQKINSYKQALQQNAQVLIQSSDNGKGQQTDIAKVKDEANVIQQSAQTLAIVLHQTDNSANIEKALRATIGNRLPACKDEQMLNQIQHLLSTGEIADLIQANELSVRCIEAN